MAPLLDELQTVPGLESLTVERWAFRTGAGGPGFDIVPVLFYLTVSALIVEAVRDVIYPKLKDKLYGIYQRLPGVTPTGKVYPMGVTVVDGELEAQYRLPEGLSDVAFGEALTSLPTHFASLPRGERLSLVFTYEPGVKTWVENVDASNFRTWNAKREAGEDPGVHPIS